MLAIVSLLTLLASPPADAVTPGPQANGEEKRVCKRQVDTGSLVRASKICRTKAEWQRAYAAARSEGANMQDRGLIQPTSGK